MAASASEARPLADTEAGAAEGGLQTRSASRFSLRKLFLFMGPGWLMSMAYLDPGNLDSDIASGAMLRYDMLWMVLLATVLGFIVQTLAATLGIVTRRHLAELFRSEYGHRTWVTWALFATTEVGVYCAAIPAIVGAAMAIKMLTGYPLWIGACMASLLTLLVLLLTELYANGMRRLEIVIGSLVALMSLCFLAELAVSRDVAWGWSDPLHDAMNPHWRGVLGGLFYPDFSNPLTYYMGSSILGSVVMPHNLFLHSALVQTRKIGRSVEELREACMYNWIESGITLFTAFLINGTLLTISATNFYGVAPNAGLHNASELIVDLLDSRFVSSLFAVAVYASGQSATVTSSLTGEFMLLGFIKPRMRRWKARLLGQSLALVPSMILVIAFSGDVAGKHSMERADALVIFTQVVLALVLPFAVIPLLKLASSERVMGSSFRLSRALKTFMYCLLVVMIAVSFQTAVQSTSILTDSVAVVVLALAFMVLYVVALLALIRRPVRAGTTRLSTTSLRNEEAIDYGRRSGLLSGANSVESDTVSDSDVSTSNLLAADASTPSFVAMGDDGPGEIHVCARRRSTSSSVSGGCQSKLQFLPPDQTASATSSDQDNDRGPAMGRAQSDGSLLACGTHGGMAAVPKRDLLGSLGLTPARARVRGQDVAADEVVGRENPADGDAGDAIRLTAAGLREDSPLVRL